MLIIFVTKIHFMKIAIPTNDKKSVFPRTGQAHGYMIFHIEGNRIKGKFYKALPADLRHKHDQQDESEEHTHEDLCEFLENCDLVLVKNIGKHLKYDFEKRRIPYKKIRKNMLDEAIKEFLEDTKEL
jgi:predicted Fe-Mo cluster-binding NifX family protein